MKNVVKTTLAVALVLGSAMSVAQAEATTTGANDGTVTFVASLKAGLTQKVDFDIELVNCVFDAQSNMSIVFNANGNESTSHAGNLALMGASGEMKGSYIVLADSKGTELRLGTASTQQMTKDSAGKALADQTLRFKAWVQGDTAAATVDTGEFSSMTSFQITYL